jgi:Tol biopolymer transport system component
MKAFALFIITSMLLASPAHHAAATKSDSRIAYIPISSGNHICILNPDTLANSCSLEDEEGVENQVPLWSPDGTMVATSQAVHLKGRFHGRISVFSADGSNHLPNGRPSPSVMTGVGTGLGGRPMWSSDSRRVAGINDNGIAIGAIVGGEPDLIEIGPGRISDAAWSPDSANFAIGHVDADGAGVDLALVDTETGAQKVLRHFAGSSSAPGIVYDISWSPDGQNILFTYSPPSLPQLLSPSQHWLIGVDGSNETMLYQGPDGRELTEARFTDDGQWIAFEGQGNISTDIFLIRPDGSDLHQLTHTMTSASWPRPAGNGRVLYLEGSPPRITMLTFNSDDPESSTAKPLVIGGLFAWSTAPGRLPPDAVTLTPLPMLTPAPTPRPIRTPTMRPSPTLVGLQGPNVGDGASGDHGEWTYVAVGLLGAAALLSGLALRKTFVRRHQTS